MLACVAEHVGERVPDLARRAQHAVVEAIREHAPVRFIARFIARFTPRATRTASPFMPRESPAECGDSTIRCT
jgi:hypothetical protein